MSDGDSLSPYRRTGTRSAARWARNPCPFHDLWRDRGFRGSGPALRRSSSTSDVVVLTSSRARLRACWTFWLPPKWFCPLPPLPHLFVLQLAAFVLP